MGRTIRSSGGSIPFICWWMSRRSMAFPAHPRCPPETCYLLRCSPPQAPCCLRCWEWSVSASGGWTSTFHRGIRQMSDTFFTASPHWTWWIIFYFFIGGIAGTAFLLASLLHLFARPTDRPLARLGYYVAFIGAVISGILLTLDLIRPLRFWHMLIESNTGAPMFKSWVPMSV